MSELINKIISVIKLLAQSASQQLNYLNSIGAIDNVDELALEFDDVFIVMTSQSNTFLSEEQKKLICDLNLYLDAMSEEENEHLWTTNALLNSKEWAEVRRISKLCLAALE